MKLKGYTRDMALLAVFVTIGTGVLLGWIALCEWLFGAAGMVAGVFVFVIAGFIGAGMWLDRTQS